MEIIFIIITVVIIYLVFKEIRSYKRWKSWPTLEEYWTEYPRCKTNRGTICYKCNSNYIRHHGWNQGADQKRIHICNQCGTYLYRRQE